MVQAVVNARRYDWETWMIGIMRSFVSGGAGAISGIAGPMFQDGKDWNITSAAGLHKTLESMAIGFVIAGVIHLAIFLQTHSAPDLVVTINNKIVKVTETENDK